MKSLDPNHFFPAGSHEGGLYLPNTVGPTILTREELERICQSVPESGVFVEVGTWTGTLSAYLADHHPEATILSVDNFAFCPQCLHVWAVNRRPNMQLFVGDSSHFFRSFNVPASGIFVDGDHAEAAVYADLMAASKRLSPGAEILAHDYATKAWTGVKSAVDRFCKETGWTITHQVHSLVNLSPPAPKPQESGPIRPGKSARG